MLTTLAIDNYRSIRRLVLPLGGLNVVTGPNGSGKSSLYRALRLLADTAQGRLVSSLAHEGGLQSVLWAGPEEIGRSVRSGRHPVQGTVRKSRIRLRLGFATDMVTYALEVGIPFPGPSAFSRDPAIKRECIGVGGFRPSALLVDRNNAALRVRNRENGWRTPPTCLAPFESMMTEFADPAASPEMAELRGSLRGWRFYDQIRSDRDAAARAPQIGTHTPVLAGDGRDVAAALQTIREIGDADGLDRAVDDAFPGSTVDVENRDGRFDLLMRQHGLLRPLRAAELSDGTLRYLMLLAALFTPRPPPLLVLNEPETSLHPDLVPALGRLIVNAATRTQVIVVTHDARLVNELERTDNSRSHLFALEKDVGETVVRSATRDEVAWRWPDG